MSETPVIWPDTLGIWLLSGYRYDQNLQLIRPQSKLGFSPGVRIRQKRPPQMVEARLLLNGVGKTLFDWFYIKKLYHGSLWFTAPIKRAGTIETLRVKMISEPKSTFRSNNWEITVGLEVYD